MGHDIILNKLENIKNCIERIESKLPFSLDDLKTNFDLQDTVTVNIQRAIQSAIDLAAFICSEKNFKTPTEMAEGFRILENHGLLSKSTSEKMVKAVGMRNVLVHEYTGINWEKVFNVCFSHLIDLKEYSSEILKIK